jgi:hypothetical protein
MANLIRIRSYSDSHGDDYEADCFVVCCAVRVLSLKPRRKVEKCNVDGGKKEMYPSLLLRKKYLPSSSVLCFTKSTC